MRVRIRQGMRLIVHSGFCSQVLYQECCCQLKICGVTKYQAQVWKMT